jgi:hypothetical protein
MNNDDFFPPHNELCPFTGRFTPRNLGGYQAVSYPGRVQVDDLIVENGEWWWATGMVDKEIPAPLPDSVRIYRKVPVPGEVEKTQTSIDTRG